MTQQRLLNRLITLPLKIGHLFFISLFLFAVGSLIHNSLGNIVQSISFLPLLGYFPGHYVNLALFRTKFRILTDISYSLVSSLSIVIVALVGFKNSLPLNTEYLTALLIGINFLAYLFFKLSQVILKNRRIEEHDTYHYARSDLLFLAIPLVAFVINYFLNPIITEGDSYYFINAARDSFAAGADISPYVTRPGFIPLLGMANLVGGLDFHFLFKFLLPVLFYLSTFTLIDFINDKSNQAGLSKWFYLLFLAAPVVGAEVDIARPQSIVFAFTVPVLLLLYSFLEKTNWKLLAVAAAYIFALALIHELAFLFAAIFLITIVTFLISGFSNSSQKTVWLVKEGRRLGIALLFLLPYWMLFDGAHQLGLVMHTLRTTVAHIINPDWNWWFLDSYETDGNAVGWKGIEALKYYLYNGVFLILPLLLVTFGFKRKKLSVALVPFIAYFVIYFAIAEILPRLGLYFYPNRAWPHLHIGLWLFVLFLSFKSEPKNTTWGKIIKASIVGTAIAGLLGWGLVSLSKGGFYSTKDEKVLEYIRTSLPSDAIIYSNQSATQVIIPYYTEKDDAYLYYSEPWTSLDDIQTSLLAFDKELQQKNYIDSLPVIQTTILSYGKETVVISKQEKIIAGPRTPKLTYDPKRPGYLYFSFSRLEGVFGSREWWRAANGYDTLQFFKNLQSDDIVYRDESGVLIKIR